MEFCDYVIFCKPCFSTGNFCLGTFEFFSFQHVINLFMKRQYRILCTIRCSLNRFFFFLIDCAPCSAQAEVRRVLCGCCSSCMSLKSVQSFVIENCNGPPIENGLNNVCVAPAVPYRYLYVWLAIMFLSFFFNELYSIT